MRFLKCIEGFVLHTINSEARTGMHFNTYRIMKYISLECNEVSRFERQQTDRHIIY